MGRTIKSHKTYKNKVIRIYSASDDASIQQKWLISVINRTGLNCTTLAKKLHVSTQAVSLWITGQTPLSYITIVALCHLTDIPDNCEKVYQAIVSDKKGE